MLKHNPPLINYLDLDLKFQSYQLRCQMKLIVFQPPHSNSHVVHEKKRILKQIVKSTINFLSEENPYIESTNSMLNVEIITVRATRVMTFDTGTDFLYTYRIGPFISFDKKYT